MQGNMYYSFTEEEYENMAHQKANHDREGTTEEENMDYYCNSLQSSCKHNHNVSMI